MLLIATAVSAHPGRTEVELLSRWEEAGPEERRRLGLELEKMRQARRFIEARPILIRLGEDTYTLAELFEKIVEPPLLTPLEPRNAQDLGLKQEHRTALKALEVLREAYEPPTPVHTGTLNLMLAYAHRALNAAELSPEGRLRFFSEALRNVRALDGRVRPDQRTRWLIGTRLVPALVGMARRMRHKQRVMEAVAEAASLFYLPSILDESAQRQLAPLTRGRESRRILLRAYRQGVLDELGMVALARSVVARTRGDAAYAAGAPPLILELLSDRLVPPRERGALIDGALKQLGAMEPFRPTLVDLCSVGFGRPPRKLEDYRAARAEEKGPLVAPQAKRVYRFLQVLLVQPKSDEPPAITRVVRADIPFYRPVYSRAAAGRSFVGVLAPSPGGEHADFLGPPPGAAGARDLRLLRRTLQLERISVTTFGALGEFIELCVALPEDQSEPVPVEGARLEHLLDLLRARLTLSGDEAERADVVALLVRIGTAAARDAAVVHAKTPAAIAALLPLAEQGHAPAARKLLVHMTALKYVERERALAAALRAGLAATVRALCAHEDVSVAVLAGDALLASGDVEGVRALLRHKNIYARAAGTSLALRLTPLAGKLRVTPQNEGAVTEIADLCRTAFSKEEGDAWIRYGLWLRNALIKPDQARAARSRYRAVTVGKQRLSPAQFHDYCLATFGDEKHKRFWPNFPSYVLSPLKPGHGMTDKALNEVLDRIESRLSDPPTRAAWRDALVVLACVQHGIEVDAQFLKLAHRRLKKLAGESAPPEARRKAGVYWPIWAAREAAGR